jgi:hypothetical protein
MRNRIVFDRIFLGVSIAATVFVIVEFVMQSLGASICVTEGCAIVARHTRFGDRSILLIGLATFAALTVLSGIRRLAADARSGRLINLILIVSLACEGFFTGYQAFHVATACLFCLIIFGFMVLLSAVRLLAGETDLIAGFAAFSAVFSLLYLVLPAGGGADFPKDERLVLFYSPDCRHCAEVKGAIESQGISARLQLVAPYASFLKGLGIEHVPTLYVNMPSQKAFLTGKDTILNYLLCERKGMEKRRSPAPQKKDAGSSRAGGPKEPVQPLLPLLPPDQPFPPLTDEGACKENAECK